MTQSLRYCGKCEMDHPPRAPHCRTCGLLLSRPEDVAAGTHQACSAMVEREQRVHRPEVGCADCGTLTVTPDRLGRCSNCALKAANVEQEDAWRRIQAAGRPDHAGTTSSVQAGPSVPAIALPPGYADALAAEAEGKGQ